MPHRIDYGYSLRVFTALAVTLGPGVAAWSGGNTVPRYPKWVLLIAGLSVSVMVLKKRFDARAGRAASTSRSKAVFQSSAREPFQMILAVLGPPCWCLAFGLFGNRMLDKTPPTYHPVRLVSYNKEPKSPAVVTVSSWRTPGDTEVLRYDPLTFGGIGWETPSGTLVEVIVKPGFFGWEWVIGMRRARTP